MNIRTAAAQVLSPSRLADFQSCPRKYQHASIERSPSPPATPAPRPLRPLRLREPVRCPAGAHARADPGVHYARRRRSPHRGRPGRHRHGRRHAARLVAETEEMIASTSRWRTRAPVNQEGVELRLGVTIDDTPLFGILDRLDRDPDGSLVIVDYKTGACPTATTTRAHSPTPSSTRPLPGPSWVNGPPGSLLYVAGPGDRARRHRRGGLGATDAAVKAGRASTLLRRRGVPATPRRTPAVLLLQGHLRPTRGGPGAEAL